MRYASVCSGVEAATLAWHPLGWTPVFFAEVEPFPCAVLQQRFNATKPLHPLDPSESVDEKDRKMRESWMKQINKLPDTGTIPNLGDFTKIKGEDYVGAIDLLVGGTPCQDLSVAGKRAGFEGARSSLALDFVRLAYEARCQYFVWENVPGVFSSNRGRDFATLLSMFCGYTVDVPKDGWKSSGIVQNRRPDRYGLAWRVLDAQFTRVPGFPFAVPQRRRRVFLVGCIGDWQRAASILLEPDRLQWDTPPRIQTRKAFAGGAGDCAASTIRMRAGCDGGGKGALIGDNLSHTLATGNDQTIVTLTEDAQWWDGSDQAANAETVVIDSVAIAENIIGRQDHTGGNGVGAQEELAYTQNATGVMGVCTNLNSTEEIDYGNAEKNRPSEILRVLRKALGEKAFSEWLGRHGSVPQEEILQPEMYGSGIRCKTVSCEACGITEIPCEEDCPARTMRNLWGRECPGCTPQGSQHGEQRPDKSDEDLQKLPQQDSSSAEILCDMWQTVQGAWILREALAEIQKVRESASVQAESVRYDSRPTVRRLLPICCERLMGFPDNHTRISWNGKPEEECPDAPRYKACGNSFCCNVVEWIGRRIEEYDK